jgi:hypothetical protein
MFRWFYSVRPYTYSVYGANLFKSLKARFKARRHLGRISLKYNYFFFYKGRSQFAADLLLSKFRENLKKNLKEANLKKSLKEANLKKSLKENSKEANLKKSLKENSKEENSKEENSKEENSKEANLKKSLKENSKEENSKEANLKKSLKENSKEANLKKSLKENSKEEKVKDRLFFREKFSFKSALTNRFFFKFSNNNVLSKNFKFTNRYNLFPYAREVFYKRAFIDS